MNTKKIIAMVSSVVMFGTVAAACGDSKKENKTPHTTYSEEELENMDNEELESAIERAFEEMEMSENAETQTEASEEEKEEENEEGIEAIDLWKDVKLNLIGIEGMFLATPEYVGDNQIIKDNVKLCNYLDPGLEDLVWEVSAYVNGYDEFVVTAWYDEEALKEQGIVLKKARYEDPQCDEYPSLEATDFCYYTLSGLGEKLEITDDTDYSFLNEATDVITEIIKEQSTVESIVTNNKFEWAKDIEIYPIEVCINKNTQECCITYVDTEGNFLAWVRAHKLLCVQDGRWCREVWENCGSIHTSAVGMADQLNTEEYIKIELN